MIRTCKIFKHCKERTFVQP